MRLVGLCGAVAPSQLHGWCLPKPHATDDTVSLGISAMGTEDFLSVLAEEALE